MATAMVRPAWNVGSNFQNVFMKTFMYGMVGSLAMFITSWEKADRMKDRFLDKNRDYGDTYDFIIVGAGSSGSIMANRLSAHYKVLLLEAGGNPHPFTTIPFMANFMSNYKELDWMHFSTPQKHAFFGSEKNRARISQGLSLGGTSNLDYMINLRGCPQDYENWASVTGDPSWGYNSVMTHFKKHEHYEGPWKDSKIHGDKGEIRIALPTFSGLGKRFCKGGKEMGYQQVDLNGPFSEGFDMLSYPTKRGTRQAAFKSFLKPAHWNLAIHKYAHVNRILTRGDNNEAFAVEYDRHGKTRFAYARKEIILAAGAIQSPKILMLSGIGPKENLESLGIPSKVNLPSVGQNLQDHMAVHLGPFFTKSKQTLLLDRDLTAQAVVQYTTGNGPLTSTGYEAAALLTSDLSKINGNPHWPDIQLTLYGMGLHDSADEDFSQAHQMRRDLMKEYYQHSKGRDSFSIVVSAGRPKSRGQVTLQDSSPYSHPVIDPRYLEQIEDVGIMIDGIKKSMHLVENTLAFQQIGSKFTNESAPGCNQYRFRSDDYWSCYVRLMSISMGDVAGTAAMGRVVNSELNVYGTSRLRVVDASIMPYIVSSSTGAATMMIGEKGAAMILDFWGTDGADTTMNHLNDRQKIKQILKTSSDKLKAVDSASLFLNNIKNTASFNELSPDDVKEALGLDEVHSGSSSETTNGKPLYPSNNLNSFKLIGAMFRNSLSPKEPVDISQSLQPNFVQHNPKSTNLYQYSAGNQVVPSVHIPTIQYYSSSKVRSKAPSVDTLFDPSTTTSNPAYLGYINYPLEEVLPGVSSSPLTLIPQSATDTYTLKPQPISYFRDEVSFSAEKPTVSLKDAVGSIISKTLPIVRNQPRQPPNYFVSSAPPGQSFTFVNRREIPKGLKSHVDGFISHYPVTSPSSSIPVVTASPPSAFKTFIESPFKVVTEPIRKVTEPFRKAFEPLRQISEPFRKMSEPFSKIVTMPFDGFMTRIRSILKPEIKCLETSTQPSRDSKPKFTSTTYRPKLASFKVHSGSLDSEVRKILDHSQTQPTRPWTNPPILSLSNIKTPLDRFTSKLQRKPTSIQSKPTPIPPRVYNYSYATQETSSDNTFLYQIKNQTSPSPLEIGKPPTAPTDYELIDWESDSSTKPTSQIPFKNADIATAKQPEKIEEGYKVIYQRPAEDIVSRSPQNFDLASNVQEILENAKLSNSSTPFTPKHAPATNASPALTSFYIEDSKNLDEEIEKLISSQNLTQEAQVYVLVSKNGNLDMKSLQNEFRGALSQNANPTSDKASLSKTVYEILRDGSNQKEINLNDNPMNKAPDSGLTISSTNLLELSHPETQKAHPTHSTTLTPLIPATMDFSKSSWATESPQKQDSMSFRIKILNQ